MKKQRRWLKAALIASAVPQKPLPWEHGQRVEPTDMRGTTRRTEKLAKLNRK